jgi:cell division protein FtsX
MRRRDVIIPKFASTLRRTARTAFERPRAGLWTSLALVCALFAVGAAAIAAVSIDHWTTGRPVSTAKLVVYLGDKVDAPHAQELVTQLRALPGVQAVDLVSAEESARRLVKSLGNDTALLDGVDLATLPASVEVTLAPGIRDVVAMSPTVTALRGAPGVADVVIEDAGADKISEALSAARTIAWSAAALFAGLALIVVLAAIRVRLDRPNQELAVVQLLGAGPGFVIVPTALAGAIQGAIAALIATVALWAGLHYYGDGIVETLSTSLGPVELATPALEQLGLFVAAGAALGLIGGTLAGASRVAR